MCVSTLHCYDREDFIHFPAFFPFFNFLLGAKSQQALGDVRALTGFCGCHWLLQE